MEVVLIGSFMTVELAVAVGMNGASKEEWMDYKNMFARSVRHLNFAMLQGHQGKVLQSQDIPICCFSKGSEQEPRP